jgi:flagellar hook-associated protein 2
MASALGPLFQAGGLISGLDTNTMVDKLTAIEALPISLLKTQQSALRTQVSTLGNLASALGQLSSIAGGFSTDGIASAVASTSSTAFSAVAGAGAQEGRFALQVTSLAAAAKQRTQAFASAMSPVTGGSLQLSVSGVTRSITITDGMQLADVAKAINSAGLRLSASVLTTGTNAYLSLTALDTGYDPAQPPSSALQIVETSTGALGKPLSATSVVTASNAAFTVDQLAFTRRTNQVSDAVPGLTLSLKATSSAPEDVVVTTDPAQSQATLQKFVDSYNVLMTRLASEITPGAGGDVQSGLAGDTSARDLQSQLQALTSAIGGGTGVVRSLADLGVKTDFHDGTLSIDGAVFAKALSADPQGIQSLFSTGAGLGAQVKALATRFTDPLSGSFTARTDGLNETIKSLDTEMADMQTQVDGYHDRLLAEFASMESILASLKSQASYLTQIFAIPVAK